jgi:MFS family permease
LYKHQFNLQETLVAALFTIGFLSGAISGYFVGQFADRHGRKTACLLFCIIYSIGCFAILIPKVPVLFFGRICGGIGTSLMYSAFESWMVTEYHDRQLDKAGMSLSGVFGIMTTLNSVVAILAGVCSEWLVEVTNTKRAPFMASAGLLALSFSLIFLFWNENYGDSHSALVSIPSSDAPPITQLATPVVKQNALKTIFTNPRILILGLASCLFEGSTYLFVFFWTPALSASASHSLPLGMIFACFMSSVMLGSLIFTIVTKKRFITHSSLLTLTFVLASLALILPVWTKIFMRRDDWQEQITFWSFCVFELCVGVYMPCIGYLKGRLIEDGVRARVYGVLRVPLNLFVVVALGLIKEGDEYRNFVFEVCSGLLVVTSIVFGGFIRE